MSETSTDELISTRLLCCAVEQKKSKFRTTTLINPLTFRRTDGGKEQNFDFEI